MLKLQTAMGMFGIPLAFLFGSWTPLMGILLVFILIDILTGITKGFYRRELRSRNMSQGMIRKAMIVVVVIIANMLDIAMFGGLPVAKSAVITFYIGMEGLSILENLAQMDVQLPEFIERYLLVMKDKGNNVSVKQIDEITIKQGDEEIKLETKKEE